MRALAVIVAGLLVAGCTIGGGGQRETPSAQPSRPVTPEALAHAVGVDALVAHLRALEEIATANGGTRETGTHGYQASVAYVVRELEQAGYEPTLHRFRLPVSLELRTPVFEGTSPRRSFRAERDFVALEYSGSGSVTAPLEAVDAESETSGCEDSDFDGFPLGAVALMRRGSCFFAVKAQNAEAAGASAALVFNPDGRPEPATLIEPEIQIPVLGLSRATGETLLRAGASAVHVSTALDNSEREAANVLADLPGQSPGAAILLGAHLDSVGHGPGINDNGSGVAAVLETAIQLRRLGARPERGLRFAFWAGEELGLHGSREYARSLGGEAGDELALVLNFDMLASRNYERLVYDADPEAEEAFLDWFRERGLDATAVSLAGRSDHAPFEELGVPVGGLFAGAEEPRERGIPHDPCYHQRCDTLANVNRVALGELADAAGATALRLALDAGNR